MRKAFLIGFEYDKEKKLPGITVDLYIVYNFLKNNGWKDEEISILTDIEKDYTTDVLKIAILKQVADPEILSFIEDCKERKIYHLFKAHNHYNNFLSFLSLKKNLGKNLKENLKGEHNFVYYSGHCKENNIILPNRSLISFDIFRKTLTNNSNAKSILQPNSNENKVKIKSKTVLIMDCCEGGIELPWILNDKIYRLKDEISLTNFVEEEIICISSSLENENSTISKSGSYFTRSLFKNLEKNDLFLFNILKKTNFSSSKQTPNISASYPNLLYIPAFIYSYPQLNIKVFPSYISILK